MREQFPGSFFCCSTWEAGKNREEAAKTKLEYNSDAEFSPTLQKNNISGSIRIPLWDSVGSRWDAVGSRWDTMGQEEQRNTKKHVEVPAKTEQRKKSDVRI